jgi:hypothetical protein
VDLVRDQEVSLDVNRAGGFTVGCPEGESARKLVWYWEVSPDC